MSLEHAKAAFVFGFSEGGRGDVEDEVGALAEKFGNRVDGVGVVLDFVLVDPDIFANGDAEGPAVEGEAGERGVGFKIAEIVENVVGGKQGFVRNAQDFALLCENGGVVDGSAGTIVAGYVAEQQGGGMGRVSGMGGVVGGGGVVGMGCVRGRRS